MRCYSSIPIYTERTIHRQEGASLQRFGLRRLKRCRDASILCKRGIRCGFKESIRREMRGVIGCLRSPVKTSTYW